MRVAALALGLGAAGGARADEPAPAPHVVRLDLARGPLITSSRITGLGGAYAGVAVGIDGVWRNPATLANRPDYSTDWFDYDLTLDWLIIAADEVDFDGDGLQAGSASRELVAVNVGFSLQFGPLALGFLATTYGYSATSDAAETVDVQFIDFLMGVAWAGDDGQWIGGGGVLVSVLNAQAPFFGSDAIALTGSALDAGFLYRPRERPWRVGAHLRFGAELGLDGDAAPATLPPSISAVEAAIPWQIGLGASYMMAADPARQYNPRLRSTIAPVLDHRYLLLSAETVVYGATGGESLEALVSGVERASGEHPSVSLHLGAEGEVFDDRVRARLGTYFEPNRVAVGLDGRLHLTGGIEIRLFQAIWMWKATFGFDLAPGWENVSIGVGFWK